jgi:hypothetical protein
MTMRSLLAVLVFALLLKPATACSCSFGAPTPCGNLSKTEVLFVGTVVDIENPPSEKVADQSGQSRYRFRVDEHFSGPPIAEVDVYSGRGGADCSFHFEMGKQYLVDPSRDNNGQLIATICSNTRAIGDAKALLPELRAIRDGQKVASLYGLLFRRQQPYEAVSNANYDQPLQNTRMQLRSEDRLFETITDGEGVYAFYDVPKGTYRIDANLPAGLKIAQTILGGPLPPLELPAGACYESDVDALPTGRIHGQVIGPDGKYLSSASLELFLADRYQKSARGWWESQGDKDHFEFNNVAPGKYILVFNNSDRIDPDDPFGRTFYPGVRDLESATPIEVAEGQQIRADIHVTGGLPNREITVRVFWNSGPPPDDAYVHARPNFGDQAYAREVGPGLYRMTLLRNARYAIYASQYCSTWDGRSLRPAGEAATPTVVVDGADDSTIDITLAYTGAGCKE